jgi:hypothetical protein
LPGNIAASLSVSNLNSGIKDLSESVCNLLQFDGSKAIDYERKIKTKDADLDLVIHNLTSIEVSGCNYTSL